MIAPRVDLTVHHAPTGLSDRIAWGFVKAPRFFADTFFARRCGHRAVVLETVAAVPGMVGADEAHHRDVNHGFANELAGAAAIAIAPCPPHVELQPAWKAAA